MSTKKRRVVVCLAIAMAGVVMVGAIIVARRNSPPHVASDQGTRTVHPGAGDHRAPTGPPAAASPASAEPATTGRTDAVVDAAADLTDTRDPAHPADQPTSPDSVVSQGARKPARAARNTAAARPDAPPADRPPPAAAPAIEPLIPAPQARMALSFVGADPVAENIWVAAINDPSLPPNTRKDLIEDLNEDGFPDPKHITEDDLPLIMNRLELITALAPESMDDVNAEAFAEAYKDLVNMVYRLMGQ
jgi:hypothetical protein